MKAMVYTAPLELQIQEVPEPEPADGEVVVLVEAVGICGSELEGFTSQSPFRVPPLIMGHEFAGIRETDGQRVTVNPLVSCGKCDLCLRGQPNVCRQRAIIGIHRPGGFAQRVTVPAVNCYPLPDDLSSEVAALTEPFANAVHAFRLAQLYDQLPRRVGVIGAGTLGLATAMVALDRGVKDVTVTDLSDARLSIARSAGATRVSGELEGEFDILLDTVGSAQTREASLTHLRPGGTAVWIGLHGPEPGFDGLDLIRTEKRVLGTFCYHEQDYKAAMDLVGSVDHSWLSRVALDNGVAAFESLLEGPSSTVKTLLIP